MTTEDVRNRIDSLIAIASSVCNTSLYNHSSPDVEEKVTRQISSTYTHTHMSADIFRPEAKIPPSL